MSQPGPGPRVSALATLMASLLLASCTASAGSIPTITPETPAAQTPTPGPTRSGPTYPPGCPTEQPPALTQDDVRTVSITTSQGDLTIRVEGSLSPIATGNFVALASCGYYDGVVFHRLVPGFVIQGGDGQFGRMPDIYPDRMGTGGPPYRIQDEPVTASYHRGTVAMARTSQPNSAGSQFFIVLTDEGGSRLDSVYQIIGTVTSGMDTVDAISAMPNSGTPSNTALDPVAMTRVTVSTP